MPVVMVTKSEEPETLKDAIGVEISDYLIKPVNPRQILSVVTRLLEGDRIRQQRLSRDFATRFRELEARRGGPLAWREWVELVVELAEWEVRLGQADEPGLQDALRTLQDSLRQDFARYLQRNYAKWLHDGGSDRPPLSVDIGAEFLRPVLDLHGRAMLVVVDCLRLDQWAMIRPLISTRFDIETAHYFSILPTATPFARNAIFSGLFPAEIKARYPQWWNDHEDASLNAHEAELLTEHLRELDWPGGSGSLREGIHCRRRRGTAEAAAGAPGAGRGHRAGIQFHRPAHPRTDREFNPVRGGPRYLGAPQSHPHLVRALAVVGCAAGGRTPGRAGATDHRSRLDPLPHAGYRICQAGYHLEPALQVRRGSAGPGSRVGSGGGRPASFGLPTRTAGTRLLLATGDRFFVYPTKLREYQARYRGAFLHGGVSPEEVLLPIALLTPRQG